LSYIFLFLFLFSGQATAVEFERDGLIIRGLSDAVECAAEVIRKRFIDKIKNEKRRIQEIGGFGFLTNSLIFQLLHI